MVALAADALPPQSERDGAHVGDGAQPARSVRVRLLVLVQYGLALPAVHAQVQPQVPSSQHQIVR